MAKSDPLDLGRLIVGFGREGTAEVIEPPPGPPPRVDGLSVGAPYMESEPPHAGEMHPDGDELLYVVSGHVRVHLEETTGTRAVALRPGEALVVPRGVWHRVELLEPSRLVHVTPGPGAEHRPLSDRSRVD